MRHTYLSEATIAEALVNHAITAEEANKLKNKINAEASIFKTIKTIQSVKKIA